MRALIITALASLLAAPAAFACTSDEADRKAQELAEKVNQVTQSDADRAAAINEEMREMRLARTAETLENECRAYDIRMEELEQAQQQADIPTTDAPAPLHNKQP
ncbi:hypothetical protein [Stutzerimonas tarimensis]|uniref:DUF1090 family protein n=1 Tax=Stutzerimonas tarimensis TaxID=1507735 RepID=A0ABV7T898_9GAMM